MKVFEHINHVDRKVYKHTFMNEILLFFTYNAISLEDVNRAIDKKAGELGLTAIKGNGEDPKDLLAYRDDETLVSFTSTGVLVNVPASKYRDFTKTSSVWENLEAVLDAVKVCPMAWTFSKGNRFVFKSPVAEKDVEKVKEIVLSPELLENTKDRPTYVEESLDKTNLRIFSCMYGMEKFNGLDALFLKTMIATQSYTVNNLCSQVMETNSLMFDCWYWTMSEGIKQRMDK